MKALSLHQPWASLIALGIKTIETRSWKTDYRGPLAIHAGHRVPGLAVVGDFSTGPTLTGDGPPGSWTLWRHRPVGRVGGISLLPLGAIVATCEVVDVVPIVGPDDVLPPDNDHGLIVAPAPSSPRTTLTLFGGNDWWGDQPSTERDLSDQRPYGDFSPGRYAWLLDDVQPTTERCPACWGEGDYIVGREYDGQYATCSTCDGTGKCEPVPARGRQRLWEWTP